MKESLPDLETAAKLLSSEAKGVLAVMGNGPFYVAGEVRARFSGEFIVADLVGLGLVVPPERIEGGPSRLPQMRRLRWAEHITPETVRIVLNQWQELKHQIDEEGLLIGLPEEKAFWKKTAELEIARIDKEWGELIDSS